MRFAQTFVFFCDDNLVARVAEQSVDSSFRQIIEETFEKRKQSSHVASTILDRKKSMLSRDGVLCGMDSSIGMQAQSCVDRPNVHSHLEWMCKC